MRKGFCSGLAVAVAIGSVAWGATALAAECSWGVKVAETCDGVTYAGCCKDGVLLACEKEDGSGPLCMADCPSNATPEMQVCGWLAEQGFYDCGGSGEDPTGTNPITCDWNCTPSCDGKQCGPDGCLGTCGAPEGCGEGKYCTADGQCATCTCDGKTCGQDGCGNPCGTCTGGKACQGGQCVDVPTECVAKETPGCPGCACETCVCDLDPFCCGEDENNAGVWDEYCIASCGEDCSGPDCSGFCVPDCGDAECGTDGCEGTCGTCTAEGAVCYLGKCCVPDCTDKECGSDGCGGTCGPAEGCGEGKFCNDSQKCEVCACGDRDCGTDECGVACGTLDGACAEGNYCDPTGHCQVCTCDGKTCGGDGCGKPCGTCTNGQGCTPEGTCVDVPPGCGAIGEVGCGGCACEACVCALDSWCCENEWDDICVDSCVEDCGSECPEVCVPDCEGKNCGDDGCNGTCGTCGEAQFCNAGTCEACTCEGKQCGDDGCGTSCGECPAGKVCNQGLCEDDPCHGISYEGCCDGTILRYCDGGLTSGDCGEAGCGWSDAGYYDCGGTGEDPTGENPIACPACTWGSCEGKECGDDGCGNSCGECPAGKTCTPEGKCSAGYPDQCLGLEQPSAEDCSAIEGLEYAGCCDAQNRAVWCDNGKLYCIDCMLNEDPTKQVCGWSLQDPAENSFYDCGGNGEDPTGAYPLNCKATTCQPQCGDDECGNGGCAGEEFKDACGTCDAGEICVDGQCQTCTPNCTDKDCGDDGCQGTCGTCDAGEECSAAGKCVPVCVPNCTGKECGDNGCDGTCGTCDAGETCSAEGKCVAAQPEVTGDLPVTSDVPKTDTQPGDGTTGDAATTETGSGGGGGGGGGCTAGAGSTAIPLALLLSSLGLAVLRRRD